MAEPLQGEMKQQQITSAPSMAEVSSQHGDYLRFRIDPSPVLRELKRLIGGKEWVIVDGRGQWMNLNNQNPLANDQFINEIMAVLNSYCNPNNIQGNITQEEAHKIAKYASDEVIFLIGQRSEEFEILETNRDLLWNMIDDMIFLSLSRAIDDMQRYHDDQSFQSKQQTKAMGSQLPSGYLPKTW